MPDHHEPYPAPTLTWSARTCRILIERDGPQCFYCGIPFADRETGEGIVVTPWKPCPGGHRDVYPCPDGGHGPFTYCAPGYATPQVEHMVPRSRGGGNELENLVASCGPCNTKKGRRTAAEFLAAIA